MLNFIVKDCPQASLRCFRNLYHICGCFFVFLMLFNYSIYLVHFYLPYCQRFFYFSNLSSNTFDLLVSILFGLAIRFIYDIIQVSMPFSQIIPPSPSPTESKDCPIHLCLFCYLAYRVIVTIFLNSIYMH